MRRFLATLFAILTVAFAAPVAQAQQDRVASFAEANADSVAVLVGISQYRHTIPVRYARNDVEAMRDWLVNVMGFRTANVFVVLDADATKGTLEDWFGDERNPDGRLARLVREGRSNVFVFYSGHGAPDVRNGEQYLIPHDTNPNDAARGYSIDLLYRNLQRIRERIGPNRNLIAMLDTCFSGNTPGGAIVQHSGANFVPRPAAQRPEAREPGRDVIRITAARADQVASWDDQLELGLLTSRFLMGLSGLADTRGAGGNGDGRVQWGELRAYLESEVAHGARTRHNRDQNPEVDEAGFVMPAVRMARVARGLDQEEDRLAWIAATQTNDERAVAEYLAECARRRLPCAQRTQAMELLAGFARQRAEVRDRAAWERLSATGDYQRYLDECGAVCSYRDAAQTFLGQQREAERQRQADINRDVQATLGRLGCFVGQPSTAWTPAAREALSAFNRNAGTAYRTDQATRDTLDALQAFAPRRVCPLVCERGFRAEGDACVRIVCPVGQRLEGSACVQITCARGRRLEGNECVPITCPTGQRLEGDACAPIVCPRGRRLEGNDCVVIPPEPVVCPAGQRVDAGICVPIVCPRGQRLEGERCVAIVCPAGQRLQGNTCVAITCPAGQEPNEAGRCVAVACPAGQRRNDAGRCVPITCQRGQRLEGGRCVAITCETGQRLQGNACVPITCPRGQTLNDAGACVRQAPPARREVTPPPRRQQEQRQTPPRREQRQAPPRRQQEQRQTPPRQQQQQRQRQDNPTPQRGGGRCFMFNGQRFCE